MLDILATSLFFIVGFYIVYACISPIFFELPPRPFRGIYNFIAKRQQWPRRRNVKHGEFDETFCEKCGRLLVLVEEDKIHDQQTGRAVFKYLKIYCPACWYSSTVTMEHDPVYFDGRKKKKKNGSDNRAKNEHSADILYMGLWRHYDDKAIDKLRWESFDEKQQDYTDRQS